MRYAYYESRIGMIEIGYLNDAVYSIKQHKKRYKKDNSTYSNKIFQQINEFLNGKRRVFEFDYVIEGTAFQKKVWNALMTVPYGSTCSYQDIAQKINNPKACRAVGNANNKNPLLLLIPCHRIINHNGKIGGFGLDLEIKIYLLEMEKGQS